MYGSSSKIRKPNSSASTSSSRRFSSESVYPAGFWKFGMMCASFGTVPLSQRLRNAAVSMPSPSSSTMWMSAPRPFRPSSVRS